MQVRSILPELVLWQMNAASYGVEKKFKKAA
jgi:hypothetical protein